MCRLSGLSLLSSCGRASHQSFWTSETVFRCSEHQDRIPSFHGPTAGPKPCSSTQHLTSIKERSKLALLMQFREPSQEVFLRRLLKHFLAHALNKLAHIELLEIKNPHRP